jgi:predicted Zn-dependent protease
MRKINFLLILIIGVQFLFVGGTYASCESYFKSPQHLNYLAARDSFQIGDTTAALSYLRKLFVSHPGHPGGARLKLKIIARRDSVDSALEEAKYLLVRSPRACFLNELLAGFEASDTVQLRLLEFGLQNDLMNKVSARKHLRILIDNKQFKQVLKFSKVYLQKFSEDVELNLYIGRAAYEQKEYQLARSHLEKSYRFAPANPEVTLWLSRCYRRLGRQKKATLLRGRWRALVGDTTGFEKWD